MYRMLLGTSCKLERNVSKTRLARHMLSPPSATGFPGSVFLRDNATLKREIDLVTLWCIPSNGDKIFQYSKWEGGAGKCFLGVAKLTKAVNLTRLSSRTSFVNDCCSCGCRSSVLRVRGWSARPRFVLTGPAGAGPGAPHRSEERGARAAAHDGRQRGGEDPGGGQKEAQRRREGEQQQRCKCVWDDTDLTSTTPRHVATRMRLMWDRFSQHNATARRDANAFEMTQI